jgi:hypothetical protein
MAGLLNWSKTGGAGPLEPCVICGKPAMCRSPRGRPCHKTCAETWLEMRDARKGTLNV